LRHILPILAFIETRAFGTPELADFLTEQMEALVALPTETIIFLEALVNNFNTLRVTGAQQVPHPADQLYIQDGHVVIASAQ
jgi:hypothetical protein